MKRILFITLALASTMVMFAKKNIKTIHVTPDNATIYVNGNEVGNGSYAVTFDKHTDFVMLKFEAPGYITKTVRLNKDNPKETIAYKLYQDEAYVNSVGSGDGATDMANKWMQVTCKKGMTEDKVWRRLMGIVVDNFENVEVRDKAAGWIKTAWKETRFGSGQTVRTRLEVRISIGGEDEDELSYKIRISSEIKDTDCDGEQCYVKYNRVLRKYYDVLNDLQNSIGSNN